MLSPALLLVLRRFLPYILGVAALMGAYFYIRWDAYNDGVEQTTQKYERAILEERERLQAANEEALKQARAREEELQGLLRARDVTISKLKTEATSDSNADRPAVGPDSVRRLNQVR